MKGDVTLDCTGTYCPVPIIQTDAKIKEMTVGQILEIVADDEGIKEDLPAWCKSTGQELLGIEEEDGEYKAYVKKVE